ncbi:amino acid transporter [Nakaseomyces bracarensis]|uniref:amino acid transporter n=1 Tax=Nakaseomyces bracarensis TaxID=273131 RepID=UPI0038718066
MSTIRSGVVTLLHTACGAGILAIPYAFRPFGLVPALFMLSFCGMCSMMGLLLQARIAKYGPLKKVSFFTLAQVVNPALSVVFDAAIAIKCFGVGVSYMIVVGDLMPKIWANLTTSSVLHSRGFNITIIMAFVVGPLCFMRSLNSLRYASMIAIGSVAYLCILVIVHFVHVTPELEELKGEVALWLPRNEPTPLTTLPIFVFAYTCHHNMFSVINEQKNSNFTHVKFIAIFAIVVAFFLYITIGTAGYLTFGDNITGNIIALYPNTLSTTIGRIAIVLLVMLAFPLQCHPARESINNMVKYYQERTSPSQGNYEMTAVDQHTSVEETTHDTSSLSSLPTEEKEQMDNKRFLLITTIILVFSYLLAISVSSLARVLAIVGATGSTTISFILPGFFGWRLIGTEYDTSTGGLKSTTKLFKYLGLVMAFWGVIVMITSLIASIFFGASH